MAIFAIKCVSGSSDKLKLAVFYTKSTIFNFSENFIFGWFWLVFRLWGQFWAPKLAPIDPAMERALVRDIRRNFLALNAEPDWRPRRELQGKTWDFQKSQLSAQFSPGSWEPNWIPRYHVVYPPRSTPGTWNFWAISKEKRARAEKAKICRRPYLAWASR